MFNSERITELELRIRKLEETVGRHTTTTYSLYDLENPEFIRPAHGLCERVEKLWVKVFKKEK
jgi:hypothetical protein